MFNSKGEKQSYLGFRPKVMQKSKPVNKYMPSILGSDMQMFAAFLEAIEEDDVSKISVNFEEGRKSVELMRGIFLSTIFEKNVTFSFHNPGIFPS